MSIVNNLYNSRKWNNEANRLQYVGPVADIVREIESVCAEKGLTLSRWQANKGSRAVTITYAVHTGPRNERNDRQESVISRFQTNQMEGKTAKCEAYTWLSEMLAEVKAHETVAEKE